MEAQPRLVLSFFPESLAAFRPVRRVLAWDAVVLLLSAIGLWISAIRPPARSGTYRPGTSPTGNSQTTIEVA
jgi:hypothetical protein